MSAMSESVADMPPYRRNFPTLQEAISYSRPSKVISYTSYMDEVRQFLIREADKPGQSFAKMSKAIGRNSSYIQQFVRKGSPDKLPEDERAKLALYLGVDETALGGPPGREAIALRPQQNARIAGPIQLAQAIPAYGHAVGGSDGQFILNGNRIADVLAPPAVAGVPDAYAVYVAGDSMEERYHAGEVVFVNPRLPVRRGDYVVAQIAADEGEAPFAYVKRFIGRTAKMLRLEQLNPKKTLEFPLARVVTVHRIVMGGDG